MRVRSTCSKIIFVAALTGCAGCATVDRCSIQNLGADKQGNCVPLCTTSADGGNDCPSGSQCESIVQPSSPDDGPIVTELVCCADGGC